MKVIANWKMHGFKDDYLHWYKNLSKTADENLFDDLGIAPPFTLLDECKTHQSKIKLGAQNISHLPEGPVTGEISAAMIKNSGADFVILGHSERRELHTETEEVIKSKILEASNHNIHPVLCIGEPKEIYAAKKTEDFLYSQLQGSLNNLNNINLSIAYEPIWAIGTGDVAKPSDINKIHSIIKEICSREFDVKLENIIYGGSVNDQNSKEIFEQEHVNGALIGGASLDGHSFGRIANNFFEIHNG
ncbi:MAG: triose-phosphate isomerase [Gammaproteobacteria bacterium]|jgi:triosephosphate isomerase